MQASNTNSMIVWRLLDGKPGHENQSLGLVKALKRKQHCIAIDIAICGGVEPMLSLATSTWSPGTGHPAPDLIVGAGHGTHWHLLAARRAYGGRAVVLMQPSLPVAWFDLCLIPQHDQYRGHGDFIETRGVLNPLQADGIHQQDRALIMLGGPSRHCDWDTPGMLMQITQLLAHNPDIHYTLTTSRRTPDHMLVALNGLVMPNLSVVPFHQTAPGWVAEQLALASTAWVSEDSVSMVYEALTARVSVGLLNLPLKQESRVSRGVAGLIRHGQVTRFDVHQQYKRVLHPVPGFIEADRCASHILHHWMAPRVTLQPQIVLQAS
ncbi:nucleoside-diphosphate sugar epimerase [Pseudomethylobacillus aquaticus]|uniref:Nucleoside-diphosphate sugar epimerase n=1 Tax=Pseudomethylobacillus aquaticus TaxID=2676064 RepID=A0A3N0UY39_9PROT|nr:mitochondrial fission ELM1 family protein [Pseudomethylobacillus aquaticus]ROH85479.1 nucleoside-diphosphate sugar epimerase [Pseudomethylobacillus aquaticus]